MKRRRDKIHRIESALIHYHRNVAGGPVGDSAWQRRLMAGVRQEALSSPGLPENGTALTRTVYRFAVVTLLVVFFLAIIVMDSNVDTQYELAELILRDTTGIDMARSFGVL